METLQQLLPLLFTGALAALVLCVGLDATMRDVLYVLSRPVVLLRALIAVSVVVPLAAVIMVNLLPLHPVSIAAIVLMAVSPVPPLMPGKGLSLGGRKEYVYGIYVAFAALTVVLVPLTIAILDQIYGRNVVAAPGAVARTVLGTVFLPLAIGMILHAIFPRIASAASVWIGRLSLLLLLIAAAPLLIHAWPAMESVIGDGTILAIVVTVLAGLIAGHLLGGPEHADRTTLATSAALRHPGVAMLIASANFTDQRVSAIILYFMITAFLTVTAYGIVMKRQARRMLQSA